MKGGAAPACAACKFQRRKCAPNCPLAPYFPGDQPEPFRKVHRLFGVSKITKTLKSLKTLDQKEDAMKSFICEADVRERFPVHGCLMVICQLWYQYQFLLEELRAVHAQLAAFKGQSPSGTDDCGSSMVIQRRSVGNEANQFLLNQNGGGGFYGDCIVSPQSMINGLESCLGSKLTVIQSQTDAFSILQDGTGSNDFEGASFNNREAFESNLNLPTVK